MKLSFLIRRYLLFSLIVIMVLGCVSIYYIFRTFIHQSTDQILYEYKERVENYIKLNDTLAVTKSSVFQPQRIEEKPIFQTDNYYEGIKDTLLYNEMTGSFQPYRQLYFTVSYKNNQHLVILTQPTFNLDDLLYIIVGLLLSLTLLLMVFVYSVGFYLKQKAWKPFFKTLELLKNYGLGAGDSLHLEDSKIKEFNELNKVINRMIDKINADFENIKTFSEDISHEMQTPLSIAKSKLELIKQKNLDDKETINLILSASRAINRLSKLNQSLLLITKIKNNQFRDAKSINISAIIKNYLGELSELIEIKEIKVTNELKDLVLEMNPDLAETMVSNLISNSIKHNMEKGFIYIRIEGSSLIFENSTAYITPDNINMFERLRKNNLSSEDSTGLGLNIIKSICDLYKFAISYSYPSSYVFRIEIKFPAINPSF